MITINTDFYPLVLSSYGNGSHSEEELRAMFEQMAVIARKSIRDRTHHIAVTLGGATMSAAERQMVAKILADFPAEYMDRTVGSFVIVPNALVRGAITALRWIAPKLVLVESVATAEEALRAGVARLAERGVTLEAASLIGARRWLAAQALAQRNVSEPPARG